MMLQSSADECNAMHKAAGYTQYIFNPLLFFIIFLLHRSTWGEGNQCIFFLVGFADQKSVNEQIEYESEAEEDLIMYPSTDTYQNLTYKVSKYC